MKKKKRIKGLKKYNGKCPNCDLCLGEIDLQGCHAAMIICKKCGTAIKLELPTTH